jgi:hypothetical protein
MPPAGPAVRGACGSCSWLSQMPVRCGLDGCAGRPGPAPGGSSRIPSPLNGCSLRPPSHPHKHPAGTASSPRRAPSVPIANENRLVVPDTLGTTIKSTSSATRTRPLAGRRWATASGQVLRPMYRACRRDVPRDLLLPIPGSRQRTGSLWLQRAEGLATQCERGRVRSAPAGTPNADSVREFAPEVDRGVSSQLARLCTRAPAKPALVRSSTPHAHSLQQAARHRPRPYPLPPGRATS